MTTSEMMTEEFSLGATRWDMPVFSDETGAQSRLSGTSQAPLHSAQHLDELETAAHEEGLARGHAEGYAAGYAAGLQAAQPHAVRLQQLLDHLARPLKDLDSEMERALVAMTIEIARRLAHLEIDLDPTRVLHVVREAVSVLGAHPKDLRVHLHPDDVQLLAHHFAADHRDWKLVTDRSLERGDCRIHSENAHVDARLDTRHAVIAQKLLGDPS